MPIINTEHTTVLASTTGTTINYELLVSTVVIQGQPSLLASEMATPRVINVTPENISGLQDTLNETQTKNVEVVFSSGTFVLSSPITVNPLKFGSHTLKIYGQGENTVIKGTTSLAFSSDSRKANSYVADVPIGIATPTSISRLWGVAYVPDIDLFSGSSRQKNSALPKSGYSNVGSVADGTTTWLFTDRFGVIDLAALSGETSLRVEGLIQYGFHNTLLPAALTTVTGSPAVSIPKETYANPTGLHNSYRIRNTYIGMTEQGEWMVDWGSRKIYYYSTATPANMSVVTTPKAFYFNGCSNVEIYNLTLDGFVNYGIQIEACSNFNVHNITVKNISFSGIRVSSTTNSVFDNLDLREMGAQGISLGGGNTTTLSSGNLTLSGSSIVNTGIYQRTYAPSVSVGGVGITVSNNVITDNPHSGIIYHGNDHIIENNLIERTVQEADDAGAIYSGQSWIERGTIVRNNLIKTVGTPESIYAIGIYLDDSLSGQTVTGNVIYNVKRGITIGGGRDNTVSNNLVMVAREGIFSDTRSQDYRSQLALANSTVYSKYLHMDTLTTDLLTYSDNGVTKYRLNPRFNVVSNNIYANCDYNLRWYNGSDATMTSEIGDRIASSTITDLLVGLTAHSLPLLPSVTLPYITSAVPDS